MLAGGRGAHHQVPAPPALRCARALLSVVLARLRGGCRPPEATPLFSPICRRPCAAVVPVPFIGPLRHHVHALCSPQAGAQTSETRGRARLTNTLVNVHILRFVYVLSRFRRIPLFATPWTVARQAPQAVGFFWQEHWSGLPFPSPGGLPHPGSNPCLLHPLHGSWILD